MTPKEAAEKLNGNQYRSEGTPDLFKAMKAAGLVVIYGASDDLMEIEGAASDEIGAYGGGTAYFTREGLYRARCEDDDCPHEMEKRDQCATVEAKWDDGGFSWRYETIIPHEKFIIYEDDEPYCEGIVFALKDVPA